MALSTAAVPYSQITNISRVQCFRPFPVRSPRISTLAMPFTHNIIINTNIGCSSWELLISGSKLPEIKVRPKSVLLVPKAAVGTEDFIVEPDTNVKFLTSLKAPGGSNLLSLAGIAFREKKIAFIGVKVYAIGFYVDAAIRSSLAAWNGKLGSQIEQDSIFFKAVSEAPVEKSLQIVLVRDIDGETFWSALDEALSPRLKFMGAAEQKALAIFQETFKGRPLKQGTIINLTWLQPSIMLVSISSKGSPSTIDAAIESLPVASALFDVYFGSNHVSPPLKKSVASGFVTMLKN